MNVEVKEEEPLLPSVCRTGGPLYSGITAGLITFSLR